MRVLVTRPEPGASETAARLEALGHQAVLLPLTEIRPLAVGHTPDAAAVEAVAITSANAVRYAPKDLIAALSRKPCYAVGDRTAQAARAAGFLKVTGADGDAAVLAGLVAAGVDSGACVVYLCGHRRRDAFEAALADRRIRIESVETYDTVSKSHAIQSVLRKFAGRPVEAALVYSVAGAEALAALASQEGMPQWFAGTRYLCLSRRISEALGPSVAPRVAVSPEPTEAALISLIGRGEAA